MTDQMRNWDRNVIEGLWTWKPEPPCHMTVLAFEKSMCGRKEPLYPNLLLFKMGLFCPDSTQNFGKAPAADSCVLQRGPVKLPCERLVGAAAMLQLGSSFLMKSGAPEALRHVWAPVAVYDIRSHSAL